MTKLLPDIKNREHYWQLFRQDFHWTTAIEHLAEINGMGNRHRPIRSTRGSHIVYKVGPAWIKLMAPIFAKDMPFEVAGLECVSGQIGVPIPSILAKGELEGWPYIIISHLEGTRIGDIFPKLKSNQQLELVDQIATITKGLHQVQPGKTVIERGDWNPFIRERLGGYWQHHQDKKLGGKWMQNLPGFVETFSEEEFLTETPFFLHADLTADHFLVQIEEGKACRVSGVIDFADCRVGHPEYEMAASTTLILRKNRQAMRKYVQAMAEHSPHPIELNGRFSEKLLVWAIIHLYSDLQGFFSQEMGEVAEGDFPSLARLVYPL